MNVLKLINFGSYRLKKERIVSHKIDSEILLSKVLKKKREEILINLDRKIDKREIKEYDNLIERRAAKEPIAYILQEKEFWSKKFLVSKDTLIPRPETELMIEKLVNIFQNKSISILDMGTGTGCILISLLTELKKSHGLGIDISQKAVSIAKKNAEDQKISKRSKFMKRSLNMIFNQKFDLIVSNPPYVLKGEIKNLEEDIRNYEPLVALDGGNDGLDVVKKVIYKAKEILKVNGLLAIEIGNEQSIKVSKILSKNNFRIIHRIKDYKDNVRCIVSSLNR